MKKLNLGCGTDIKNGWINADIAAIKGIDKKVDLNKYPWPFKNDEFDFVLCKDVLEHLDDFKKALKELHRITKKKGRIEIAVPHYTSPDSFGDPTHKRQFSSQTFLFFKKGGERFYYFDFSFKDIKIKISFLKKIVFFYNYLIEPIVNINNNSRLYYENSPLSVFPAQKIIAKIKK